MFPNLAQTYNHQTPQGYSDADLFEHCVKYAASKRMDLSPKTHGQWANLLFPNDNAINSASKMSRVKYKYNLYFTPDLQYTFDVQLIVQNYPEWFAGAVVEKHTYPSTAQLFINVNQAIDQEIHQALDKRNLVSFRVLKWEEHPYNNNNSETKDKYIYSASILVNEDEDPHFREGTKIRVKDHWGTHVCEVIEYDYVDGILYFTSIKALFFHAGSTYIYIDNSFILEGLKSRILHLSQQVIPQDIPLYKFLNGTTQNIIDVSHEEIPQYISSALDSSQRKAFDAALNKDITFIWGPPGTGKSYTLAAIIMGLFQLKEERTVVCCVSNVAVDQLVNKVVDNLLDDYPDIQPGNFYRAGHTTDERIIGTDFLFPNDDITRNLRKRIQETKTRLDELTAQDKKANADTIIELKAIIKDLRVSLHNRTDYLVQKSRVVFSTISNFTLSDKLNSSEFDNLIVDEASMLAMPSLIALAGKVKKRIILVGDFQQLSPIALVPNPILTDNVFKLCNINIEHTNHPALHLLLQQRRSQEKIVDLINEPFYNGNLIPTIHRKNVVVETPPFVDRVISVLPVPDGAVRFTKGGTRQNHNSANAVMELLDSLCKNATMEMSIGVITPYRGQANLLRALKTQRNYPSAFDNMIRIGTVHTFQGSESDIIIFDLVDCEKKENGKGANVGKIFGGPEGEQLLNVAISRARHKFIIVGAVGWFADHAPGNAVTDATRHMMRKLYQYRVIN